MLSIVTANWNGGKYLSIYLESLQKQSNQDFMLYLIDNGSEDDSLEILKEYEKKMNIRVFSLDRNIGFSGANNLGLKEAMMDDSEYIITFNNDLELDPLCLEKIQQQIQGNSGTVGAYQVLMINHFERNLVDAAGLSFNEYYDAQQIAYKKNVSIVSSLPDDIDGVCAGAAVYNKKALQDVMDEKGNFFDERYFAYFEDVDLALRLKMRGYSSRFIRDAVVYHVHSGTSGKGSPFKEYYLSRNNLVYRKKNLPKAAYRKFRYRYGLQATKNIFRHLIHGRLDLVRAAYRGYSDFIRDKY